VDATGAGEGGGAGSIEPNHVRPPCERKVMAGQRPTLALAAALLLGLLAGVQRADAATVLGSIDPSGPPEAFACAVYACPAGKSVGFRQLALHGSDVEVDEPGVLVSARVNAKRITGGEQPRIAVLKPAADDDIAVTIGSYAPVPIVSSDAEVHEVQDLHLPVEPGDAIGFLLPSGQVDLGTRTRRQPDGTVQWFVEPCAPCHMDGGTGRELLFEATIEPDADEDFLGDESQDPDFGLDDDESDAPAEDEFDDWFDELDGDEPEEPASRRAGRLRLLDLDRARNGDLLVKVGTPGAGRLGGVVTTSAGRWDIGVPRTIGVGQRRAKRGAPVRLRLHLSRAGRHLERRPGRRRARIVVYHLSRDGIKVTMRQIRL
jgi:hypothetical protein